MPSTGPAEQTKKHTETLFSVVIDPEQFEGSREELAAKAIETLSDLGLNAESHELRHRLSTGPATVYSNLPRTEARRVLASLALRSITAKLSRVAAGPTAAELKAQGTAQGLPTSDLEQPVTSEMAMDLPDTEPAPLAGVSTADQPEDEPTKPVPLASANGGGVAISESDAPQPEPLGADTKPAPIDEKPRADQDDPTAADEEPTEAGAEPVVSWGDVVSLDSADHPPVGPDTVVDLPFTAGSDDGPSERVPAGPPAAMVAMVPADELIVPPESSELLNIALGVDDDEAPQPPLEPPQEGSDATVKRAALFGVLAPGGGQMYLGEGARARGYAVVGLLIRPWIDAARDAKNLARSNARIETSAAKASGFVAGYWLILLCLIWLIAGLFSNESAPTVDPPDAVTPDEAGQDAGMTVEEAERLAAELEERQQLAEYLQLMRDANRACGMEIYARCANLACRARDLIPERDDAVRLCHRATIAAAEQSAASQGVVEPERPPFEEPAEVPEQDEDGEE